jgi:hypothetical protein
MSPYGGRSKYEAHVERGIGAAPSAPGTGTSRTPLESLEGIVTPNGLPQRRHDGLCLSRIRSGGHGARDAGLMPALALYPPSRVVLDESPLDAGQAPNQ